MIEILFFAALSAFILFRLFNSLGQYDDEDENAQRQNTLKELKDVISQTQEEERRRRQAMLEYTQHLPTNLQKAIVMIQKQDQHFAIEDFIEKAKAAFEIIVDALNQKELETLEELLSPEIYRLFLKEIERREIIGHIYNSSVAKYREIKIEEINIKGSKASIKLHFATEQILLISDNNARLIEEHSQNLQVMDDTWTFEKDFADNSNIWRVVSVKR